MLLVFTSFYHLTLSRLSIHQLLDPSLEVYQHIFKIVHSFRPHIVHPLYLVVQRALLKLEAVSLRLSRNILFEWLIIMLEDVIDINVFALQGD